MVVTHLYLLIGDLYQGITHLYACATSGFGKLGRVS